MDDINWNIHKPQVAFETKINRTLEEFLMKIVVQEWSTNVYHSLNSDPNPMWLYNLRPTVFPADKIYWDNGGTESVGVANQWLAHLETHEREPPLTQTGGPVPRG